MSEPTQMTTTRRETHAQATSRKGGQKEMPKAVSETESPPKLSGKRGAGNGKTGGKSTARKLSIATSAKNKGASLAKGARKGTKRLSVSASPKKQSSVDTKWKVSNSKLAALASKKELDEFLGVSSSVPVLELANQGSECALDPDLTLVNSFQPPHMVSFSFQSLADPNVNFAGDKEHGDAILDETPVNMIKDVGSPFSDASGLENLDVAATTQVLNVDEASTLATPQHGTELYDLLVEFEKGVDIPLGGLSSYEDEQKALMRSLSAPAEFSRMQLFPSLAPSSNEDSNADTSDRNANNLNYDVAGMNDILPGLNADIPEVQTVSPSMLAAARGTPTNPTSSVTKKNQIASESLKRPLDPRNVLHLSLPVIDSMSGSTTTRALPVAKTSGRSPKQRKPSPKLLKRDIVSLLQLRAVIKRIPLKTRQNIELSLLRLRDTVNLSGKDIESFCSAAHQYSHIDRLVTNLLFNRCADAYTLNENASGKGAKGKRASSSKESDGGSNSSGEGSRREKGSFTHVPTSV